LTYGDRLNNDRPENAPKWDEFHVKLARMHVQQATWKPHGMSRIALLCRARLASLAMEWAIDLQLSYVFCASRSIEISLRGAPTGHYPTFLPRVGWTLSLTPGFDQVQWYGHGPGESYKDIKSLKLGLHASYVDDMYTHYEYPQEGGNRTDTRWALLRNDASDRILRVTCPTEREGFNLSALHYCTEDIDPANHPHELHREEATYLRIDYNHAGVGTGACSSNTLDQYQCKTKQFEFKIVLELR
jgi:beta-galactosidase